jgi:hypothetical protein
MRQKSAVLTICLAVFAAIGFAQQSSGSQDKSGAGPMGQGMMGGGMMGQMTAQHQEMSQLMTKMMDGMAAIKGEKDPAKLKAQIAEQSALLDQMHAKMMGQGNMMQKMAGQMKNCTMMGDSGKSDAR